MIFIITIEKLDYSNVDIYSHFLFDLFMKEININKNDIVAFGARFNNIPCGALFANINDDKIKECIIKSFFVSSFFRKNGVGSKLLDFLKEKVSKMGVTKIIFQAITSKENIDMINNFLTKRGFSEIDVLTAVYRFNPKLIIKNNRFIRSIVNASFKLPDKVEILLRNKVNGELIDKVKEKQGIDYPDNLSPFANEFHLKEECTRFAIFDNKEVVGWMTGLKAPNDIILYRSLFVREDYRKSALGYFILSECIKYHNENYIDKKGLCAVALDNENAMKFISLYFKNMYDHKKYEFKIEMDI